MTSRIERENKAAQRAELIAAVRSIMSDGQQRSVKWIGKKLEEDYRMEVSHKAISMVCRTEPDIVPVGRWCNRMEYRLVMA